MVTGLIDAFKRMRRVRQILGFTGGGEYKRIDENRELLELLNEKAPALVADHPWLVGWFESQDEFLCELASAVPSGRGGFHPWRHTYFTHISAAVADSAKHGITAG